MQTKSFESTNTILSQLTTPKTQSPYLSLFDCITKNKSIHELLNQFETTAKDKVQTLLEAIQQGLFNAAIFDDKDCQFYLLLLIKNNQIDFNQAMTVYIYLIGLQQFTPNQHLKAQDLHYETPRAFSVVNLMEEGRGYLKELAKALKDKTNIECFDELEAYVQELPPSEQWLMKIAFTQNFILFEKHMDHKTKFINPIIGFDVSIIIGITGNCAPYFQIQKSQEDKHSYTLFFPSLSIIEFCLNKVSPQPLALAFLFGRTGLNKLSELHKQDKHPILLYSHAVKSNMVNAHDFNCGPFGNIFHDLSHAYWGSLLPLSYRHLLYDFLIPNLTTVYEAAEPYNTPKVHQFCHELIEAFGDYDLLGINTLNENLRCKNYVKGCIERSKSTLYGGPQFLGERQYDFVLFQLEKIRLQQKDWSLEQINLWNSIISNLEHRVDTNRKGFDSKINDVLGITESSPSLALKALAKRSLEPIALTHNTNQKNLDWNAWLEMVNTTTDSQTLWEKASNKLSELLTLILQNNLTFFHPYVPMTQEYKTQFKQFLEEGSAANKALINASSNHFRPCNLGL